MTLLRTCLVYLEMQQFEVFFKQNNLLRFSNKPIWLYMMEYTTNRKSNLANVSRQPEV